MPPSDPLAIPEIGAMVAQFLPHPDQARCLRVCKSWHKSFLQFVWSAVSIEQDQPKPPMDALRRNRLLIKELECEIGPRSKCMSPEYTNLQHLSVVNSDDSLAGPFPISFWRKIHDLRHLSRLELHNVTITVAGSAIFWNLCTRLDQVKIIRTTIGAQPDMSIPFPRLKRLSIFLTSGISERCQIDWIRQFPNLISLEWDPMRSYLVHEFNERLSAGTWTKLSELKIQGYRFPDEQLALMIKSVNEMTVFELYDSFIMRDSYLALRRHFPFLRHLNTFQGLNPLINTAMSIDVLTSCPRLEYFHMGQVMSELIPRTPSWVYANSLKTLRVHFIITKEQDQARFQRLCHRMLSELVQLETLHLSGSLNIQLDNGLELLASLSKLRALTIHTFTQELTTSEVEWMISHWKKLESVDGILNPDNNEELANMFLEAGVKYER
ncbi:hypothetical protein B0O80DRAFT_186731 [Mortierella sp. GBAus27b]|nr:hypothetical protein B0O80DRAFT_186731 [Mortierella sp. GBAus27b]